MSENLDIRERGGLKGGHPQWSDRRLWLQLFVYTGCRDISSLTKSLENAGIEGVLYERLDDPLGVGLLVMHETPDFLATAARAYLQAPPFSQLTPVPEYSMLGRTYSLGHEPDLLDWLLAKPRRATLSPDSRWAVWYPLRRTGAFNALPPEEQVPILREHGKIGHAFGEAGHAQDVRLACFGVDQKDSDFIIGLIGKDLYPLSACVQAMRKTKQTSQYIAQMGPFFVGRAVWQSPLAAG